MSKWLTALLFAVVLAQSMPVEAATSFRWNRNTESDMLEYKVYTCSTSATCVPNVSIGVVPQPPVGTDPTFPIPLNTQGRAAVTAINLEGTESALSNIVNYDTNHYPTYASSQRLVLMQIMLIGFTYLLMSQVNFKQQPAWRFT